MEKSYSNNAVLLNTEALKVGYLYKKKEKALVNNIDISLLSGELVALVGLNGIGKSSLLRTLVGLQKVLSGKIFLDNENIQRLSAQARARKLGMVFSTQSLPINFSVYETVSLGRYPHTNWYGQIQKADEIEILKALEIVKLKNKIKQSFQTLSDGEKQKTMIARALAQNTPLLLLDEPTAHLDWVSRRAIFELLNTLALQEQKGILVATHELGLALQYCQKIWVLDNKQSLWQGTPQEVIQSSILEEVFMEKELFKNLEKNFFSDKNHFL